MTFASGYVANCNAWTVTLNGEELGISALGNEWAGWIPGLRDWSGTFNCLIDSSVLSSVVGSTDPTMGNLNFGTAAAAAIFVFEDHASTGEDGSLKGNIIVTGAEMSAQITGQPNTINLTFRGDGAPSITQVE